MPADFDEDPELVAAIAMLQSVVLDYANRLQLAQFAATSLANRADYRGDVHRVSGLDRALHHLKQAAGLATSAAAVLRMVEDADERPQEPRADGPRPGGFGAGSTELRRSLDPRFPSDHPENGRC